MLPMNAPHIPVLLEAVLETYAPLETGRFVDCTVGYGGHSHALLEAHPDLKLVAIDRDAEALTFSRHRLAPYADRIEWIHGDFASVVPTLDTPPISGLLADFGVSSLQLDKAERGFGFESDRLDMRMDQRSALTAEVVVNTWSRDALMRIFADYGEIRAAARLADAVIRARTRSAIRTPQQLSRIARETLPQRGKIHPATLMFQAIRIAVNDELGQIERLLDALETLRPSGAIVGLITFHSLEDRLVKHRFKRWSHACICPPDAPRCTCGNDHSLGTMLTRKPITASSRERRENPRSRSAKLRAFRFKESAR
jgi:16S rRNA (cytosine1402-N4)-methyltransferase